ncbi:hypothetical protein GCM10022252_25910 [Streptosporangium oxazolinicum]|uniref:Uncharacterized protein n=1 Tax=Streptosporangium oxazolinicum TaxID=909287 RepID=A0ABP8AS67_9ACTN
MLGVAGLLLVVSFWEWFGITVAVGGWTEKPTAQVTANAWQASTAWSVAVLLGVAAAVLWCVRLRGSADRASRPAALAFVALGILLVAWQWWIIPASGDSSKGVIVITAEDSPHSLANPPTVEEELGKNLQEGLSIVHEPGYYSDVRLGLWTALLLLVLELALMAGALLPRIIPPLLTSSRNRWAGPNNLSARTDVRYRETMFFEPVPAEREPSLGRPELPPWSAPPSLEAGAVLAVERVVARSANVVVLLPTIRVFGTGCLLEVEVVSRQGGLSAEDWWYLRMAGAPFGQTAGRGGPPDSLLRLGVRFADGTKVTTLERTAPSGGPPDGPTLSWSPTGGGMRGGEFGFSNFGLWLWPLPPAENFEFAVEWPLGGIEPTIVELDGAAIVSAAERSARYWSDDDR